MSGRDKRRQERTRTGEVPAALTRWGPARRAALATAAAVGALLIAVLLIYPTASRGLDGLTGDEAPPKLSAVIIDQLSLTAPNPEFAQSATEMLEDAGYAVDYYPGEEITVNFYRYLPTRGYDLLIFRTHSGLVEETEAGTGETRSTDYVALFTGEPYSDAKYDEPVGRLGAAVYREGGDEYFAIAPDFITDSMLEDFDGATVLMMGCDGLRSQLTADAFIQKGVSSFVSWDDKVTAAHTDTATENLLQKLLIEELPIREAVTQTASEVGPDPDYGSNLLAYP